MAGLRGLDRMERPRLYEQVVERVLDHVIEQSLDPGDRLPPERDLAERLGVSRATVAQALVALEVLGVIDVQHGNGAVLLYRPSSAVVLRGLREHTDRLPDIVDARSAVETKIAELAALRRTPEDLAAVEDALELMARDIAAGGRGLEGDELFHAAVTAAAHSSVLARLMTHISDLVRETRIESLSQRGRPQRSLQSHWAIAEAIRNRDADGAAQSMAEHIQLVSDIAALKPE